jgi:hypothetical protein
LLTFGVAGLAQIEEIKVQYENRPTIEKFSEVDLREVIITKFNDDDPLPMPEDKGAEDEMTKTGKSDRKDGGSPKKKKKKQMLDAM